MTKAIRPDPKTDRELHEAYDSFLDEAYPDLQIAGLTYSTSYALKEVDPTAYRCGFNVWLDGEISNGIYTDEIDGEYYDASEYNEYLEEFENETDPDDDPEENAKLIDDLVTKGHL